MVELVLPVEDVDVEDPPGTDVDVGRLELVEDC